jgi:hypothetical protein
MASGGEEPQFAASVRRRAGGNCLRRFDTVSQAPARHERIRERCIEKVDGESLMTAHKPAGVMAQLPAPQFASSHAIMALSWRPSPPVARRHGCALEIGVRLR